ncbi:ubiquitin carboxyl-terminal hydrolase 29-like [Trichomycterus rosablanca]|uniref:ubiquitin carboxyl-terminal hydrolase 29-like n=1 Tax=Trichomycterus rosablanca TaxID=2290929 RepID=UPI002F35FEBF
MPRLFTFRRNNKVNPVNHDVETVRTTEDPQMEGKLQDSPKTSGKSRFFGKSFLKRLFSRKKKVPPTEENVEAVSTTESVTTDVCTVDEAHSEEAESPTPVLSDDRKQELQNRGFDNLGNSCYVNASMQCLFSAESFCKQLMNNINEDMPDESANLTGCFAKLWSMRDSSDWSTKNSLVLNLIEAAALNNPEFTPDTQNMCSVITVARKIKYQHFCISIF